MDRHVRTPRLATLVVPLSAMTSVVVPHLFNLSYQKTVSTRAADSESTALDLTALLAPLPLRQLLPAVLPLPRCPIHLALPALAPLLCLLPLFLDLRSCLSLPQPEALLLRALPSVAPRLSAPQSR